MLCASGRFYTCDWCLDVQYSFLLTQDCCSLIDDSKCHSFLHTALLGQVGLQKIHARFSFAVKHFLHCKTVAQGEGDSWGQSTGTWWHLSRVTMAPVNAIKNTILDCFCHCGEKIVAANSIQGMTQTTYHQGIHAEILFLKTPSMFCLQAIMLRLLYPSLLTVYVHPWHENHLHKHSFAPYAHKQCSVRSH